MKSGSSRDGKWGSKRERRDQVDGREVGIGLCFMKDVVVSWRSATRKQAWRNVLS